MSRRAGPPLRFNRLVFAGPPSDKTIKRRQTRQLSAPARRTPRLDFGAMHSDGMTTTSERQLVISTHARQRLDEMSVSDAEVRSVLDFPLYETYSGYHRSDIFVGRRIAVCVANDVDRLVVKTVIWREHEAAAFLDPERVTHLTG